jgi:ribosomal protein L11 methyltransferase
MKYTLYEFFTRNEVERDWLVSILTDYAFEGFEETSESLKAYVPVNEMENKKMDDILSVNELGHIEYTYEQLEDKNWNEEWEKNFEPVVIAGKVAIRAPFHQPIASEYEIVIEPKMSFGTGHHATTASVVELMLQEPFENKTVLDFGSGTGVLAILAEKMNASEIIAIDNEDWAYQNCIENAGRNNCVKITAIKGDDSFLFGRKFDIILANINRNVILKNISAWSLLLNPDGILIVSGILLADEADIINAARHNKLAVKSKIKNNGWLAIAFNIA